MQINVLSQLFIPLHLTHKNPRTDAIKQFTV